MHDVSLGNLPRGEKLNNDLQQERSPSARPFSFPASERSLLQYNELYRGGEKELARINEPDR